MSVRILHCGTSLVNYYLCLNEKVAGFLLRGQKPNDIVYFSVKVGGIIYVGARAVLIEETDFKPWPDADRYKSTFAIKNIEFCKPFDLAILRKVGGGQWYLKYVQVAKNIGQEDAIKLLDNTFKKNKATILYQFSVVQEPIVDQTDEEERETESEVSDDNIDDVIREIPELKVTILATFQTINFVNESDRFRGIEVLVNDYFYSLFPQYKKERSLLIPENRLFRTAALTGENTKVTGIRATPDALLLVFDKNSKRPFQINLIEYECYGEGKVRNQEKSNYFNGHIIPQLMRFASTFSIVTEKQIREDTIASWSDKIINYIFENNELQHKVTHWVKELNPGLSNELIGLKLKELLTEAIKYNLKILLIIDDLSIEQKDTITNVIKAFRLENNESIQFTAYIIRLEQRIKTVEEKAEYALSVQ